MIKAPPTLKVHRHPQLHPPPRPPLPPNRIQRKRKQSVKSEHLREGRWPDNGFVQQESREKKREKLLQGQLSPRAGGCEILQDAESQTIMK